MNNLSKLTFVAFVTTLVGASLFAAPSGVDPEKVPKIVSQIYDTSFEVSRLKADLEKQGFVVDRREEIVLTQVCGYRTCEGTFLVIEKFVRDSIVTTIAVQVRTDMLSNTMVKFVHKPLQPVDPGFIDSDSSHGATAFSGELKCIDGYWHYCVGDVCVNQHEKC